MKRWKIVLAVGMLAVLIALVVVGVRPGLACPAVAYVDLGDVELEFASEPDSVAACFADDCSPRPVQRSDDGKWRVPQSSPYMPKEAALPGNLRPGNIATIRIVAARPSAAPMFRILAIHSEPAGGGQFWSMCPGPIRYMPVQVP
jgi:hypothetical protein